MNQKEFKNTVLVGAIVTIVAIGGYFVFSSASIATAQTTPRYTQNLYFGLKNSQVNQLQQDFTNDSTIYPEKLVTGYFGPLTLKAVKRFQAKYGIIQTGYVGPLTRAKLNELYTYTFGGPNNCKPGYPCVVEENEGKKKVSDTPEVQALAEKYGGWEHVHIGALDIDLVRHTAFIEKIYPNLAKDTGCIIIAHAGDEGYVYREDKNLNIAYQETLAEFMERTKDFDPEYMAKFYLSLH